MRCDIPDRIECEAIRKICASEWVRRERMRMRMSECLWLGYGHKYCLHVQQFCGNTHISVSLSLVLCVRMLIIPPDILAWCAALISVGEECTLYTRSNNFQAHIRQIVSHWKSQISFQALCHFSTVFHSFCLVNDVTLHGAHNFHSFSAQQCMTYNFN